MGKKSIETLVGGFVLLGMLGLVFLAMKAANLGSVGGGDSYLVQARFDNIGGLKVRAPVRTAGVTVGRVTHIELDRKSFQAIVSMEIGRNYQFPTDSAAKILTAGLLGDQYIGLDPGGDEKSLAAGATVPQTQSAVVLENLIGQFLSTKADAAADAAPRCVGGLRSDKVNQNLHRLRAVSAAVAIALLTACASAPPAAAPAPATASTPTAPATLGTAGTTGPGMSVPVTAAPTPGDPWENWNRKVFAFNDAIDKAVLKPVAETYQKVVPSLVRTGIGNVLGNIRDVWSAANQLLQGKVQFGMEMGMRVVTNSIFGLAGLLDPATEMGLIKRPEDFGQTLGRWGVGAGPYLVLPLLGPSTTRDTAGLVLDRSVAPSSLPPTTNGQFAVAGVEVVDTRARLLSAGNLLDQVALDRYSFLRDAYLAQRRDSIYDGAPPMDTFDEDPGDGTAKPTGGTTTKVPGSAASAAPSAARSSATSSSSSASAPSASSAASAASAGGK